jgi:hypothetical protein
MKRPPILIGAAFAIGAVTAAFPASAQGTAAPERERARIVAERAAAEARYSERQRECATQNRLDDGLRRQRADERAEAIRRRKEDDVQHSREAAQRPAREHAARDPLDRPSARKSANGAASPTESSPYQSTTRSGERPVLHAPAHVTRAGEGTRLEQEARSRATFDAAQRAAEAHRAEIDARNAHRAATHKPSRALPVPDAASAP